MWLTLSYLTFLRLSMWRVVFCGVALFWLVGFYPVDGDSWFLRNIYIYIYLPDHSVFCLQDWCSKLINSLRTPWRHWGVEVQLYLFLISKLDENSWSASKLGRFTPLHLLTRRIGGPQRRSGWFWAGLANMRPPVTWMVSVILSTNII